MSRGRHSASSCRARLRSRPRRKVAEERRQPLQTRRRERQLKAQGTRTPPKERGEGSFGPPPAAPEVQGDDGHGDALSDEGEADRGENQPMEPDAGNLDEYGKQLRAAIYSKAERIRRESNAAIASFGRKIQGQMKQTRK